MAATTKNLLFLCTGNACRSQMAEALARDLLPAHVRCWSAGIVAHGMNPHVATVMSELNISLEGHYSKSVDELPVSDVDVLVTVCGHAAESCPDFPAQQRIHQPFADPPKLALDCDSDDSKLDCYRQVRDQIATWLQQEPLQMALR